MKRTSILFCLLFAVTANSFITAKAQVNTTDSLALVDLYNSTNGPSWKNHTNWLTTQRVSTWYGVDVKNKRVIQLYISENNLSGTIPASIGNLVKLTYLELSLNQLSGSIPTTIGSLDTLKYLFLHDNQLSGTIPASIGKLVNLAYLSLSNNQLTGAIPASVGKLASLVSLSLDFNKLSAIPNDLANLKNLTYLTITNNQLSGAIPISLNKLQSTSIDLSGNRFTKFADGYPSKDTDKINIFLYHNYFTFDGLQVIGKYYPDVFYDAQDTILPIHQNGNVLSVSAGGTLSNNIYYWHQVRVDTSIVIKKDSTFTPSVSGKYYVSVTNKVAFQLTLYSDTINYTMPQQSNATFLAENTAQIKSADSKLLVYPNPAKDIIHVQVNGNAIITLTNSAGKIIFSKSINNDSEINVSSYANGVYYLQNKTTGETQKIVVVH